MTALPFLLGPAVSAETDDAKLSAKAWRARLDGKRFSARVRLTVDYAGKREDRLLDVWRDDVQGRERVMARFASPPYLRGFALLYLEKPGKLNDYFVYQPAVDRVRRISATLANEDVYGVDLEFLGFGIAQAVPTRTDSFTIAETEKDVHRVVERPLSRNPRFEKRTVDIDPLSLIPVRTEHHRNGRPVLIATTERIEEVQGIPTPMLTRFVRPAERSEVVMEVEEIDYLKPIPEIFFSTVALMK